MSDKNDNKYIVDDEDEQQSTIAESPYTDEVSSSKLDDIKDDTPANTLESASDEELEKELSKRHARRLDVQIEKLQKELSQLIDTRNALYGNSRAVKATSKEESLNAKSKEGQPCTCTNGCYKCLKF